jgi:predicted transcriptional regulator
MGENNFHFAELQRCAVAFSKERRRNLGKLSQYVLLTGRLQNQYRIGRDIRSMGENTENPNSIGLTAGIVSAFVRNNSVRFTEIPALINSVHAALARVSSVQGEYPADAGKPAVAVKKSITADYIICLEDGKKFKMLKRHLRSQYNMTPEQYREKWGLATEYPMVAPNYAAVRSQLAKEIGLGQKRQRRT